MDYTDLGYDSFGHRTILSSNRQSPISARNSIPYTSLSASSIGSPLSASTDITFSSTDNDTAAWTAGTIYFADGSNSGQVASGNTGNIGATTYVYFDKNQPQELQTTTDHSEAIGPTKFLLAIVETGPAGGDCKITPTIAAGLVVSELVVGNLDSTVTDRLFSDSTTRTNVEAWKHSSDATLIDGGDIYTNSVTVAKLNSDATNRMFTDSTTKTNIEGWKSATDVTKIDGGDIYTNTVTATQISVSQLDALAVNTGTLTVDESISSGQTAYDTGTGFWMEYNSGTPRFSIGKANDSRMLWTGSALEVYNSSNSKVIDSSGLVSTNNFQIDTADNTTNRTTDSTTLEDLANASLSLNLSRNTRVLILFTGQFNFSDTASGDDKVIYVTINVDGTDYPTGEYYQYAVLRDAVEEHRWPMTMHRVVTIGSGSHTIKIRWKLNEYVDGVEGVCLNSTLSYITFGE